MLSERIAAVKADLKARWFDSPAMIDDCVDSTVAALAEAAQVPVMGDAVAWYWNEREEEEDE